MNLAFDSVYHKLVSVWFCKVHENFHEGIMVVKDTIIMTVGVFSYKHRGVPEGGTVVPP